MGSTLVFSDANREKVFTYEYENKAGEFNAPLKISRKISYSRKENILEKFKINNNIKNSDKELELYYDDVNKEICYGIIDRNSNIESLDCKQENQQSTYTGISNDYLGTKIPFIPLKSSKEYENKQGVKYYFGDDFLKIENSESEYLIDKNRNLEVYINEDTEGNFLIIVLNIVVEVKNDKIKIIKDNKKIRSSRREAKELLKDLVID